MSTQFDLLGGCVTVITGLALQINGKAVTVIKGKLPKVEEGLEVPLLPILYVSVSKQPGRCEWYDTGNAKANPRRKNTYLTELISVSTSNRDPVTGLADVCSWRETAVKSLGGSPSQVGVTPVGGQVLEVDVNPDPVIDREAWMSLYDVSGMHLMFGCVEPALPAD